MKDYSVVIDSVIEKYRNELNNLHPKATFPNEIELRHQYSLNNRDKMNQEIKSLMKDENIDIEDIKIRQAIINALNLFAQYCSRRRT